jgi:hypothetical protein
LPTPVGPRKRKVAVGLFGLLRCPLRPLSLSRTVKLVAFVNEEAPFFYSRQTGSWVYASAAALAFKRRRAGSL